MCTRTWIHKFALLCWPRVTTKQLNIVTNQKSTSKADTTGLDLSLWLCIHWLWIYCLYTFNKLCSMTKMSCSLIRNHCLATKLIFQVGLLIIFIYFFGIPSVWRYLSREVLTVTTKTSSEKIPLPAVSVLASKPSNNSWTAMRQFANCIMFNFSQVNN